MNVPRYAALAARLLGRASSQLPIPAADRERSISTIERAMAHRVGRRRLRRLGLALGIAATAAAAWLLFVRHVAPRAAAETAALKMQVFPRGDGGELTSGAGHTALRQGASVHEGETVETAPHGGASMRLSTGTSLELEADSSLRVLEQGSSERFALPRGRLAARVAKLHPGQRFIVQTPDAEVEVRGTAFRLSVLEQGQACGGGTRTRLQVSEGVVEVRSSGTTARVRAGQTWPGDCALGEGGEAVVDAPVANAHRPERTAGAPAAQAPAAQAARSEVPAPSSRAAPGASPLVRQNDLFAEGVALRRQGDASAALRVYQELIAQFPNSPLAENAMVERMRLLAVGQRAGARAEARRYLARYPRGFAAAEARRLAEEP